MGSPEEPVHKKQNAVHVVCLWPSASTPLRAERQHQLLVTSEHKEVDKAEVIGSPGGDQLMRKEPVPEDNTSPVLGSSTRRVPKGQTLMLWLNAVSLQ